MPSKLLVALKRLFKKPTTSSSAAKPSNAIPPPLIELGPAPPAPSPKPSYPEIANLDPQTAIYSVEIEVIFTRDTYDQVRSKSGLSTAFIEAYQCLSEGVTVPYSDSETKWDEYGLPTSRTESYGTEKQGLFLHASPKTSGHGTHGESGYWTFTGLPSRIKITGEHHIDYRKPTSRLKLVAEGLYECQGYWLIQNFALALRTAIGGDWYFHEGTWSQTAPQSPVPPAP
jgi:hypothetical protein